MKLESTGLRLSAADLARHLGCPHLTQLDRAAAEGRLDAPSRTDPILEMLRQQGLEQSLEGNGAHHPSLCSPEWRFLFAKARE